MSLRLQGHCTRRTDHTGTGRNNILRWNQAGQVRWLRRALRGRQRGVCRRMAHGQTLGQGHRQRLNGQTHRGHMACRHARQRHMARLNGHIYRNTQPRRHSRRTRHLRQPTRAIPRRVDRRQAVGLRRGNQCWQASAAGRVEEQPLLGRTHRISRRPHLRQRQADACRANATPSTGSRCASSTSANSRASASPER